MYDPDLPVPDPSPEPFRVPDEDLDDLATTLARTIEDVRQHGILLDHLTDEHPAHTDGPPPTADADEPTTPGTAADEADSTPASLFILALGGQQYATELAALTEWVTHLLLPVYGREISTTRPWCPQWQEHPEAVARLHALWLAWQQHTDITAGLTGPDVWHRDHHDHTMAQLRAPDGPFAACTTSPNRPHHRLLPTPADLGDGAQ